MKRNHIDSIVKYYNSMNGRSDLNLWISHNWFTNPNLTNWNYSLYGGILDEWKEGVKIEEGRNGSKWSSSRPDPYFFLRMVMFPLWLGLWLPCFSSTPSEKLFVLTRRRWQRLVRPLVQPLTIVPDAIFSSSVPNEYFLKREVAPNFFNDHGID